MQIRDHAYRPEEPWHRDCCQHRQMDARGGVRVCNAPRSMHEAAPGEPPPGSGRDP